MTDSQIVSVSKKIATLEMKELNERQRAEHAQKMYEHLQNSLKQVEQRNSDLENKFVEVNFNSIYTQTLHKSEILSTGILNTVHMKGLHPAYLPFVFKI